MKTLIHLLTLLAVLLPPVTGNAELVYIQDAIEATSVNVRINEKLTGTISVSPCIKCKTVYLKIDPNTKAEHHGKPVHLYNIKDLSGKPATVIYDTKTKTAVKVIW